MFGCLGFLSLFSLFEGRRSSFLFARPRHRRSPWQNRSFCCSTQAGEGWGDVAGAKKQVLFLVSDGFDRVLIGVLSGL